MKSLHPLVLAVGLAVAIGAAGCSAPCQDLGDRICQCEPEGQVRNNCKTNVKARVRAAAPTGNETSYCSSILGSCPDPGGDLNTCAYMLNTCEGKVACGLALPLPEGCPSPCQDLGDRICQCVPDGPTWERCMADVIRRAQIVAPNLPAAQTCRALLATCPDPWGDPIACEEIFTTCPGQVACGLARADPAGGGCTPIPLTSPLQGAGAP